MNGQIQVHDNITATMRPRAGNDQREYRTYGTRGDIEHFCVPDGWAENRREYA